MKFVIHHAETGVILRHGTMPADEIAHQEVPDGHAVLSLPDDHPLIDDTRHQVVDGVIAPRAPVALSPEQALRRLRQERNRRLAASDWTQLPDSPFSTVQVKAWAIYRQALRDFPELPAGTAWPIPPSGAPITLQTP